MQIHEKTKAKPTLLLSLKKADGSELEMEMGISWYGYENGNGASCTYIYVYSREPWSSGVAVSD